MPETVTLKSGIVLQESIVKVVLISLKEVKKTDPIAFYELVHLARDPHHQLWTGPSPFGTNDPLQYLRKMAFLSPDNTLDQSVREVIVCAVEGDDLEMKLVNPLAEQTV